MKLTRRSLIECGLAASAPMIARTSQARPNILFLISDDHTYKDLGCYGNRVIRTPNLDRLASEGMRFNNCYVASPQCSPNRSAILTGCTPHTTATSRLHTPMPEWEPTFLEPLKERGYFVGAYRKVHQGAEFDKRWNFYGNRSMPFEKFFDARPADRPFFLHVGFTDPHRPYRPGAFSPPHNPKHVEVPPFLPDTPEVREDLAHYYDAIARMDSECGQILEILKRRNLLENTIIFFTADNGMPFPRAKGTNYDAGIRVPLIVWAPGRIQGGSVRQELISHVDLAPTWLEIAGIEKPRKMQGRSFLPLLEGRPCQPRTEVFSERNWHDNFDPIRSVRTSRYKLIFNAAPHFPYRPAWDLADSPSWKSILRLSTQGGLNADQLQMMNPSRPLLELYDLEEDPDEFYNLVTSPRHREILLTLQHKLSQWMHETYDYLPPAFAAPGEPKGRGWPVSL